MSAFGPKQTCTSALHMSAFGGKADMTVCGNPLSWLGRNVRQPNCVLANWNAGHKAERRPGASEEGLAAAQHDGAEVEVILINKTKVGQASRQVWSADCNLPNVLSLQLTNHHLEVILDKRSVRANRLQRA